LWRNGSIRLREEVNLANLLTLLNGLVGFFSIVFVLEGDVKSSLKLILLATILDGLDGRVARLLNKTGELGKELDSLADIISFGVAPSLLILQSKLLVNGYLGTITASSLVIAGIIRLARFNIIKIGEYFIGLPIPAAGCFLALYLMSSVETPPQVFTGIVVILSLLMISNLKYPSFKARHGLLMQGITLGTVSLILLMLLATMTSYSIFKMLVLVPFVAYIVFSPLIYRVFREIPHGAC